MFFSPRLNTVKVITSQKQYKGRLDLAPALYDREKPRHQNNSILSSFFFLHSMTEKTWNSI